MAIDIIFDIFADNPPSILIGGGAVGWILCGFTNVDIFCSVWPWLLSIGVVLQILWLIFN